MQKNIGKGIESLIRAPKIVDHVVVNNTEHWKSEIRKTKIFKSVTNRKKYKF